MKKILLTFLVLFTLILTNVYAKGETKTVSQTKLKQASLQTEESETKIIPFIGTDVGIYVVTPKGFVLGIEHSFIKATADKIYCFETIGNDILCLSDTPSAQAKLDLENSIDLSIGRKIGNFIFTFDLGFNNLKAKDIDGTGIIKDDDIAFTFGVNLGYLFEKTNMFLKAGLDYGAYSNFSYNGENVKLGEYQNSGNYSYTYNKSIFFYRFSLAIGVAI
jgi:hypothetical protein